jgi:hypothetical protein
VRIGGSLDPGPLLPGMMVFKFRATRHRSRRMTRGETDDTAAGDLPNTRMVNISRPAGLPFRQ